jgi:thiopurine S-methyltransferase
MKDDYDWEHFWKDRWEQKNIGFHQSGVEVFLKNYFPKLREGSSVFVPLCGKSKDMLFFLERGYEVVGVELSEIACQAFFDENHLKYVTEQLPHFTVYRGDKISIYCGDFFEFKPEWIFNLGLVYDRGCLIALPSELRSRYAEKLHSILEKQALDYKLFIIVLNYDQTLKKGPPFSVLPEEVLRLYENKFKIERLASDSEMLGTVPALEEVYILSPRRN